MAEDTKERIRAAASNTHPATGAYCAAAGQTFRHEEAGQWKTIASLLTEREISSFRTQ